MLTEGRLPALGAGAGDTFARRAGSTGNGAFRGQARTRACRKRLGWIAWRANADGRPRGVRVGRLPEPRVRDRASRTSRRRRSRTPWPRSRRCCGGARTRRDGPPAQVAPGLGYPTRLWIRSKSCSQLSPSWEVSQRPEMVEASSLKVPVNRWEKSSGEKSGEVLQSFQTPSP